MIIGCLSVRACEIGNAIKHNHYIDIVSDLLLVARPLDTTTRHNWRLRLPGIIIAPFDRLSVYPRHKWIGFYKIARCERVKEGRENSETIAAKFTRAIRVNGD